MERSNVLRGMVNGSPPSGAHWLSLLPMWLRTRLVAQSGLAVIISNAGWLVLDKILRIGIGVIVGIWVARYLGPADFGLFSFAQSITVLFSFVSTLGLADILVRDLSGGTRDSRSILASAFVLRITGAALAITLAVGTAAVVRPGAPALWMMVALISASQLAQAMDVIDSQYQSRGRVKRIVLIRSSSFLLFSSLKIFAILSKQQVMIFAGLYTAELFLVAVLLFRRATNDELGFGCRDISIVEIKRLFLESMPLIMRLAAIGVYMRVDQVLIGRLMNDAAVGLYVSATRLTELWYFVATAIVTAVVPRLAAIYYTDPERYVQQLKKVVRVLVWAAIAVAAVTSLLAPWAIELLYGNQFVAAVPVLIVHAWAAVFSTFGQAVSAWFVNKKLMRFGFYQAVIGAIVNIAVCLILIPRIGIVGAAVAAVASQAVSGLFCNMLFSETRSLFWLQLRALVWR